MKGMVFTEFLEMVEAKFSPEMVDHIIEKADLPSGGAYTAVGTYEHGEMVALVTCLSQDSGIPVPDLVRSFGEYLFERFYQLFPRYFEGVGSSFEFLSLIEDYIHIEVRKLYPDAELPSFAYEAPAPDRFILAYQSARPFAALAEGLVRGCIQHYGEPIELAVEDLSGGQGTAARFLLTRQAAAE